MINMNTTPANNKNSVCSKRNFSDDDLRLQENKYYANKLFGALKKIIVRQDFLKNGHSGGR